MRSAFFAPGLRQRRLWSILSVLFLVLSLWLFLQPDTGLGGDWFDWMALFGPKDKVQHFLVFLGYGAWFASLTVPAKWWRVGLAFLLWAVLIELLQAVLPTGRSAELLDVAADAAGLVAGLAIAQWRGRDWLVVLDRWLPLGA